MTILMIIVVLAWVLSVLAAFFYFFPYIFWRRISSLSKTSYVTSADSNPVVGCCPLNHWQPTVFIMVSH